MEAYSYLNKENKIEKSRKVREYAATFVGGFQSGVLHRIKNFGNITLP